MKLTEIARSRLKSVEELKGNAEKLSRENGQDWIILHQGKLEKLQPAFFQVYVNY